MGGNNRTRGGAATAGLGKTIGSMNWKKFGLGLAGLIVSLLFLKTVLSTRVLLFGLTLSCERMVRAVRSLNKMRCDTFADVLWFCLSHNPLPRQKKVSLRTTSGLNAVTPAALRWHKHDNGSQGPPFPVFSRHRRFLFNIKYLSEYHRNL